MIEFLVVALLQAVAGSPAAPAAEPAAQEQAAGAGPAAPAPVSEEAAPAAEEPAAAPTQYRRERRCREIEVTGRRMPQRVCTNVMVPVEEPAAAAAEGQ